MNVFSSIFPFHCLFFILPFFLTFAFFCPGALFHLPLHPGAVRPADTKR